MTELERKADYMVITFMMDSAEEFIGKNPDERRALRMKFVKKLLVEITGQDLPSLEDYSER